MESGRNHILKSNWMLIRLAVDCALFALRLHPIKHFYSNISACDIAFVVQFLVWSEPKCIYLFSICSTTSTNSSAVLQLLRILKYLCEHQSNTAVNIHFNVAIQLHFGLLRHNYTQWSNQPMAISISLFEHWEESHPWIQLYFLLPRDWD